MSRNIFKTKHVALTCVAVFLILGFSADASSSIQDLRSTAIPPECVSKIGYDCRSPQTGNIYQDYIWKDKGEIIL